MAGKRISPKKHHWAPFVVILAVAALVATIGGTMAWLTDGTDDGITNTFTPATISGQIVEDFTNKTVKKDVAVKNTSDVPVYVRVALVPTWVTPRLDEEGKVIEDADGNIVYDAVAQAAALKDLTIDWGVKKTSDWIEIDGYYYYKYKVAATNGETSVLIDSAKVETENGYQMNLQVLAQAIQADGVTKVNDEEVPVVETVWPVEVTASGLVAVN